MIVDSAYWKSDLTKIAERMNKLSHQRRWTERTFFNLEKDVFIAFYAIRKLIEANKLTSKTLSTLFSIKVYPSTKQGISRLNWHNIDSHFEINKSVTEQRKLVFICNQIIHSYIFIPCQRSDNSLESILFSSDRDRNSVLYELTTNELIRCLISVAIDDPTSSVSVYNEKVQDYDVDLN